MLQRVRGDDREQVVGQIPHRERLRHRRADLPNVADGAAACWVRRNDTRFSCAPLTAPASASFCSDTSSAGRRLALVACTVAPPEVIITIAFDGNFPTVKLTSHEISTTGPCTWRVSEVIELSMTKPEREPPSIEMPGVCPSSCMSSSRRLRISSGGVLGAFEPMPPTSTCSEPPLPPGDALS